MRTMSNLEDILPEKREGDVNGCICRKFFLFLCQNLFQLFQCPRRSLYPLLSKRNNQILVPVPNSKDKATATSQHPSLVEHIYQVPRRPRSRVSIPFNHTFQCLPLILVREKVAVHLDHEDRVQERRGSGRMT